MKPALITAHGKLSAMVSLPFYMAGQIGIVKDIADHELPPLAWSDGENVIFRDGKITRCSGNEPVLGTPTVVPYWLMFAFTPTDAFWLYTSLTKAYATDGASHADVTRAVGGDYGTLPGPLWNGGILSGIPVITNGVDVPQSWSPVSLGQKLVNLPNWPATVRCKVLKPYKNFLVALGVSKSSTFYPHLVKWSHPADPGAVPSSWDETNPALLAGEVEIGDEQPGQIEEALQLRDMLVIYKTNTVHGMQFIGGNSVFRFFPILNYSGILSTHCVALVREGRAHIVATADDLVVFDGQNTESVLDERWKKFIEDNLEAANADRSFVVSVPRFKEAWFCFPTTSNTWPNMALIWNWQENTITARELPANLTFMTIGALTGSGDTWDMDPLLWDSDAEFWDVTKFRANFFELTGSQISPSTLLGFNRTQQSNGVDYTAFVERRGLAVTGRDRVSGQFKSDIGVRKIVNRMRIKAKGSPFQVKIGGQEYVDGPVVYLPAQTFTPGVDRYLDFVVNTPLIAIRFESSVAGEWTIDGYDLEFELAGDQ